MSEHASPDLSHDLPACPPPHWQLRAAQIAGSGGGGGGGFGSPLSSYDVDALGGGGAGLGTPQRATSHHHHHQEQQLLGGASAASAQSTGSSAAAAAAMTADAADAPPEALRTRVAELQGQVERLLRARSEAQVR